jgi:cell division protein FtsQ
MKKTGSKRGSGYASGSSSTVLEAPEESHASGVEPRIPWQGGGPAPAGALQRGYGRGGFEAGDADSLGGSSSEHGASEEAYVPRRGAVRVGVRGAMRSVLGRILLGLAALLVLGTIGVTAAALQHYALHDPRFVLGSTDEIQIEGAEHLTRDQALSVFGADLERDIFRISLDERKADLERLPWVEHATVMRLLPNNLRVLITERTPVAFVRQGTQIGLVDASGVLLDMPADAAGNPHYSFPVLTGLSATQTPQERAKRMQVYHDFMAALRGADGHVVDSLSEVDVTDPEDVKALMASGGSDILVHFGEQKFLKRYQEFEQHLPEWKQLYPKLASADMRYEGQVVLEMQPGAGGAGEATATVAGDGHTAVPSHTDSKPALTAKAEAAAAVAKAPTVKTPGAKTPHPRQEVVKASAGRAGSGRRVVVKKRAAKGTDAANQRVFAALAAAHKAALAKAAAAGR